MRLKGILRLVLINLVLELLVDMLFRMVSINKLVLIIIMISFVDIM